MSDIREPHRGQLGQASTAGGVAVIVAMFTSHENWREHNESATGGRCSLSCSLPIYLMYAQFVTMASRMYDTRAVFQRMDRSHRSPQRSDMSGVER